jgi:hypothetical protein
MSPPTPHRAQADWVHFYTPLYLVWHALRRDEARWAFILDMADERCFRIVDGKPGARTTSCPVHGSTNLTANLLALLSHPLPDEGSDVGRVVA